MNNKSVFTPVILGLTSLVVIVLIGVVFYMFSEGYSITEAFFMTVITIATVGFREVKPLSTTGMWFTSFLIVISFGLFGYAVTTFTRFIVDGVFRNYYKTNKMRKKIAKLSDHTIVVGYGRNGSQAVKDLQEHDMAAIVIDKNDHIIERLQEDPKMLYVQGDATQDEILRIAQIDSAMALITALPNDADNLFVVVTARAMNPNLTIISRASNFTSINKLKSAGATNVIMPDKIGGQRMAKLVAQPDVVEFMEYIMLKSTTDVHLEEISCKSLAMCFEEKSIGELGIRNLSGANIIGLKNAEGHYVFNPSPTIVLSRRDQLFVLGNPDQIRKLKQLLNEGVI